MTGFGEAERSTPAGLLLAEVRTVNHRHFHVNFRVPPVLSKHEGEMREWLHGSISRGHANCVVRLESHLTQAPRPVRLDEERVAAYMAAFREMGEKFGVAGEPDVATLSRFADVFRRDEPEEAHAEIDLADVRAVVTEAAARNVAMREDEGRRLHDDLEGRLRAIDEALEAIAGLAPARLAAERDRLREAVRELAGGVGVTEERLAQEIAFLAERWDVNEELVRFRSHNELFRELLASESAEPVGKRLAFLVQEMHREANTIGSKANHAGIAHRVVAIKDEVERLREQVENVE